MDVLSFTLAAADSLSPVVRVEDMGEGTLLLCEELEDGRTEMVCLERSQIEELYRYVTA